MAVNRVLTDTEKEILQGSSRFRSLAIWSLKNFSCYWAFEADANTKVGQVGYVPWAKNYVWASRVLNNLSILDNDSQIPLEYAVLLKGMNLWDSAVTPFNFDTCIDYMVANSKFDELSVAYVNKKTVTPIF